MRTGEYSFPPLPEEHVAALQAVDLHLYFGIHGSRSFLPGLGPAILSVTDDEYERIGQMAADLNPARGDVLATENIGFETEWNAAGFLYALEGVAEQSPWLKGRNTRVVHDSAQEPPSADAVRVNQFWHVNSGELIALAGEASRFQIIVPHEYGVALAIAKGVTIKHADATSEEMEAWKIDRAEAQQRRGLIGNLVLPESLWEEAESWFRSGKMVDRLGSIAVGMDIRDPEEPPRLDLAAGEGHRRVVTRLLTANGVPFTQHKLTPHPTRRYAAMRARDFISYHTGLAKTVREKGIETWVANTERAAEKG